MHPNSENIPFMLYADGDGRIFEHPYFRMAGFSGTTPVRVIWNNSRTEYEFWTENSHYRLSVLGKVESPRSSAD